MVAYHISIINLVITMLGDIKEIKRMYSIAVISVKRFNESKSVKRMYRSLTLIAGNLFLGKYNENVILLSQT